MKKLNKIESIYELISQSSGELTTDDWGITNQIKLIQMSDGTFALGIDIYFNNSRRYKCRETRRIKVDKNGVPYISLDENKKLFTEKNCKNKISSFEYTEGGYNHIVNGNPVYFFEYGFDPHNSIFEFVGDCLKDGNVKKYFSRNYDVICLSSKGLAILTKYVENPENKEIIEKCVKPSFDEINETKRSLYNSIDDFVKNACNEKDVLLKMQKYKDIVNKKFCIPMDLSKYEYLLNKNPGQLGD